MNRWASIDNGILLGVVGGLALTMGLQVTQFALASTGSPAAESAPARVMSGRDRVYARMSRILDEEVPQDVLKIDFKPFGKVQACTLSNATHEQEAAISSGAHGVTISGEIWHTTNPAPGWPTWDKADGDAVHWIASFSGKGVRYDGEAISAPEFRDLVRRCVEAVRNERLHPRLAPESVAENLGSWEQTEAGKPPEGAALTGQNDWN